MAYGDGQGFSEGVRMMGGFVMPALQMHAQNQRFDKQMATRDKQFYDRLAVDQAWKDGFYGGNALSAERAPAQDAPSPAASLAAPERRPVSPMEHVQPRPQPNITPHTPLPSFSMMRRVPTRGF